MICGYGEFVDTFIFGMSAVSLDPTPVNLVSCKHLIQGLPKVFVFDGLFLRFDFFAMIAGLLWVLPLAWSLLLAVVLIGLLLGWPLMWATVAVEHTDAGGHAIAVSADITSTRGRA